MRLATLRDDSLAMNQAQRDGRLVIVNRDGSGATKVPTSLAGSLREALERWNDVHGKIERLGCSEENISLGDRIKLSDYTLHAPLPRCFSFLDGSAYLSHVRRVRKARGAEMPAELEEVPLMYQGISAPFMDPCSEIVIIDEEFGFDFEAELAVVVDDVPQGIKERDALAHIKLLLLLNDLSLRNLVPAELARGFGFVQSKPSSSCAPFAVTPDELGEHWQGGRADLTIRVTLNGSEVGDLRSSEMKFSFAKLIEHAARTRSLPAGSIIGSGTVSNEDQRRGVGCLVEKRMIEIIDSGQAKTPYLASGDVFTIEAFLGELNLFGTISHRCVNR